MRVKDHHLPKISIITPSYNQGNFLEETILSVLNQRYPNLEYIIIDGGSTDNSLEIIKRYENKLAYWESEQDDGQYHAINKGFSHATGEIMAWLNSDDMYFPWTLQSVSDIFSKNPEIQWLTSCFPMSCNQQSQPVYCRSVEYGFSQQGFLKGEHFAGGEWFNKGYIQQESTFWRSGLWEKSNAYLNENFDLAADFELWAHFFKYADLIGVNIPLALFRSQDRQKSVIQSGKYIDECHQILELYGGQVPGRLASMFKKTFPFLYLTLRLLSQKKSKRNLCVQYRTNSSWTLGSFK